MVFIHPNSLALAGMRAALRDEFSHLYIVNLRGDAYKSGEEFQQEGDKVFSGGSRNGVQITVAIRNPDKDPHEPAMLHSAAIILTGPSDMAMFWMLASSRLPDLHNVGPDSRPERCRGDPDIQPDQSDPLHHPRNRHPARPPYHRPRRPVYPLIEKGDPPPVGQMGSMFGVGKTILAGMQFTPEQDERITELARNPTLWEPAGADAWERGRRMAQAVADTYTDEDWRRVLNRLTPPRAARKISRRPAEDREYLLELLDPEHRAEVERLLTVTT